MSDTPQDHTWWMASDGRWYPPQPEPQPQYEPTQQFGAVPPPYGASPSAQPPSAQPGSAQPRYGQSPLGGQPPAGPSLPPPRFPPPGAHTPDPKKPLLYGLVGLLAIIVIGIVVFVAVRDSDGDTKASDSTEATDDRDSERDRRRDESTTTTPVEDNGFETDDTIADPFETDDTIADPFGSEELPPELEATVLDATWDSLSPTEQADFCAAIEMFGLDGLGEEMGGGMDLEVLAEKVSEWCPGGG